MKSLIVANWKMNPSTLVGAKKLFNSIKKGTKNIRKTEVVICPPFVYIPIFQQFDNSTIRLGAQDIFWEQTGAYTGEVSAAMLKDAGVEYAIIGHSERRRYLKEADEMINKKIKAALAGGLKPILCVANLTQLEKGLKGVSKKIIIAYEPVSAIGTGKPYSVEKAKKIRKGLVRHPLVLYGGSVNSRNCLDYIKKAGFRGLLIGGASINAKEFIKITKKVDEF